MVRFWAGARRAAGHAQEDSTAATLKELRSQLGERAELADVIRVCSFLVDGQTIRDDEPLPAGATVDVLPPFAGG